MKKIPTLKLMKPVAIGSLLAITGLVIAMPIPKVEPGSPQEEAAKAKAAAAKPDTGKHVQDTKDGKYARRGGPLNLPHHVSDEVNDLYAAWVPFWKSDSGVMPAADDYEGWLQKRKEKNGIESVVKLNDQVKKDFPDVEVKEVFLDGVRVLECIPKKNANPDSVLIFTHPGGLYAQRADTMLIDTIPVADALGVRVLNVDYKKIPGPPKGYSVDDQIAEFEKLYKHVVEDMKIKPANVGWYSCSAGSSLAAMVINKMSHDKYPLPGAFAPNAGVYDWNSAGDTWLTLDGFDPVVHPIHYIKPLLAMMDFDPVDPKYSPVYDDFKGREFPPTMWFCGGREMMLSDTLQMNLLLKEAGHDSEAVVFDGIPHCWPSIYQSKEAILFQKILKRFMTEKGVLTAK